MAPLPPPPGASLARSFHIGTSTQPITANPMVAASTSASFSMLGGYPITSPDAQTNMPATFPITRHYSSGLPAQIANNPRFTTMQGAHGLASSTSSFWNDAKPEYLNADGQQPLTDAIYSKEIDMPDCPFVTAAPASKHARTSKLWFPERRTIYYRSNEHQGGGTHINNTKKSLPLMLANRLKKKFRAKVIADCKVQQYDECRRDIEALANQEFEKISREHATQLDSQRILAEKSIRDSQGDRADLLESIRSLEQAKKAVESEAKEKDQQIRDLKADLQKHSVTTERAERNAQANSEHKSKEIMDLQAENASLKDQVDFFKEDLKASIVRVENLKMALLERPTRTETTQQAQIIRNLANSNERLKSVVAEQAQTLVDCKNVNNDMMQELAHQKSEKANLEDKIARLRKELHAKRQIKEDVVKHMEEDSAVDLELTAAAFTEKGPTAEVSTEAVASQDEPTPMLSAESSTTLVMTPPAVASAPAPSASSSSSVRNIFGNLILLAYCFLFGNPILSSGLVSLLIFSRTKILFSAASVAEENNDPSAIGTTSTEERKIASMPGGWAWWEEL